MSCVFAIERHIVLFIYYIRTQCLYITWQWACRKNVANAQKRPNKVSKSRWLVLMARQTAALGHSDLPIPDGSEWPSVAVWQNGQALRFDEPPGRAIWILYGEKKGSRFEGNLLHIGVPKPLCVVNYPRPPHLDFVRGEKRILMVLQGLVRV